MAFTAGGGQHLSELGYESGAIAPLSAAGSTGWARGGRLSLVIAARYAASPVGPYTELALAACARHRARIGLSVTTMVVGSAASEAAGRRHWGFPKELGQLRWTVEQDDGVRTVEYDDGGVRIVATPSGLPSVPVYVPLRALQYRGETVVVVPGRLRARARLAHVAAEARADSVFHRVAGIRRGFLLTDLRLVIGQAVPLAGSRE